MGAKHKRPPQGGLYIFPLDHTGGNYHWRDFSRNVNVACMVRNKLSSDEIKAEVHRFWNSFQSKSADFLTEMYSPEATVFSSVSSRVEPGHLAAARRRREYFHAKNAIRASVTNLDVILLSDVAAVASYNFTFHSTQVASGIGSMKEEDIRRGRGTHVFTLDHDGKLKIVHEHFSVLTGQA